MTLSEMEFQQTSTAVAGRAPTTFQKQHDGAPLAPDAMPANGTNLLIFGAPLSMVEALAEISVTKTSDEVADFLRANHVKGSLGDINACPLAVWARKQPGMENAEVNEFGVSFSFNNASGSVDILVESEAARTFVKRFDAGDYPDLVAP